MRLLILSALIFFSFAPAVMAEDTPTPTPVIAACATDARLACHGQQALALSENIEGYRRGEILSLLAQKYFDANRRDLLEPVITALEKEQVSTSGPFSPLLLNLAKAGEVAMIKRLIPSIYLCMPHPHSGCMTSATATDVAIILMNQLLAKNEKDQALDIAFLALRYNGGLDNSRPVNHAASTEFYRLITSLDYLPRLKKELEELSKDPRVTMTVVGNPEQNAEVWRTAEARYLYAMHFQRLLMVLTFDPAQIEKIPDHMPAAWTEKERVNFYSRAINLLERSEGYLFMSQFTEHTLKQLALIKDEQLRKNAAANLQRTIPTTNNTQNTDRAIQTALMNENSRIRNTKDYVRMEEFFFATLKNYPLQASSMRYELGALIRSVLASQFETGKIEQARALIEKLERVKPQLTADSYPMMRMALQLAENDLTAAQKTLTQFTNAEAYFAAFLRYAGYIEKLGDSKRIEQTVEIANNTIEALPANDREKLLDIAISMNSLSSYNVTKTNWPDRLNRPWHGSNVIARYLAQHYMPAYEYVHDPEHYFVSIVEGQIANIELEEAVKTLSIITKGEALRKSQMLIALAYAKAGQIDKALEIAPAIIWDESQPELYRAADRTDWGVAMWDTRRADLIQLIAPTHYDTALKLAREITSSYELARANLYLAQ